MEIPELTKKALSVDKRKKFIYGLIFYANKNPFFITELERYFGYNNPQQDLRKLIKELIKIGVFYIFDQIKNDYRYKINLKILQNLIRNGEMFKTNGKFIEETKGVYIY